MALNQQFRSAFRGFNREDVVQYIDYLNNHYSAQIEHLREQLQAVPAPDAYMQARLDAAEARCAQLEEQLAELQAAAPAAVPAAAPIASSSQEELEAYRRAESAERQARERAQQIYIRANAVLAEVTLKAESASAQVAASADQVAAKLQEARTAFDDAVAALYAIRPEG